MIALIRGRMDRRRLARLLAAAGTWCLPAFALSVASGLAMFALLLLTATLLVPLQIAAGARVIASPLKALSILVAAVLVLVLVSRYQFGLAWTNVDSRARLLLLPWCVAWAYVLQPPQRALWTGALWGLAAALAIAVYQVATGMPRAQGWSNAIVFSELVLMLMTLAVFCRPPGRWGWALAGLSMGAVAIVLSGSRGVWPGVALLAVVMTLGSGWKTGRTRMFILACLFAVATVLVVAVPLLGSQMRVVEMHRDIDRLEQGDSNSSTGARLRLLSLATTTFGQHPLTGIGVGSFNRAVRSMPECRRENRKTNAMLCNLGHAHNDVAEWGATLGIPGLIAIIAIYGVPLWWFVHLIGLAGMRRRPRGPAWAGAMIVVLFVVCGQTQSIFAHQLTSAFYACVVGILMGWSLREAMPPDAATTGPSSRTGRDPAA